MLKKKERTPEQKEKFNKKFFKIFVTLVIVACMAIGAYNGFKTIDLNQFSNLNAFTELKQTAYNINTILTSAQLTNKDLLNYGTAALKTELENGGVDLFVSNQFDLDKWTYCDCESSGFTLTDINAGMLTRQLYDGIRAVGIAVDSGNQYSLTIVEYINFRNIVEDETLRSLLPANAYITTRAIITITEGKLSLVSSAVRYNGLNQDKSDVITSVIDAGSGNISNYSSNHFVQTLNALATKTNTSISLDGSNCIFTSLI